MSHPMNHPMNHRASTNSLVGGAMIEIAPTQARRGDENRLRVKLSSTRSGRRVNATRAGGFCLFSGDFNRRVSLTLALQALSV